MFLIRFHSKSEALHQTYLDPYNVISYKMAFPSNVCFGETLSGETQVRNTSDCPGTFRTRFQPSGMSEEVSDPITLQPGQSATFPFQVPEFPGNTVNLTETLELQIGDDFTEVATRENTIEPQFPNFQVVSAPYPGNTQPGDPVSANLTIQNSGPCSGTAEVTGTKFPGKEFTLQPGQTSSFVHELSMPGGEQSINLSITDSERGVEEDTVSALIEPSQAVIIDTAKGQVSMIGGFSTQLRYAGTIQGANLGGESLESSDKLVSGQRVGTFSGTVSTSPGDSDIITFDKLEFLNMQFGSKTQWVFDGDIQGEAESFQYSTYPVGVAENLLPLQTENPEISIRAGPTDRLSRLRNLSGMESRVFKNPLLRRTKVR